MEIAFQILILMGGFSFSAVLLAIAFDMFYG
jgi:hypothetical protein